MIAPVAACGCPLASNETNQICPRESRIVESGREAGDFRDTTVQVPGAGPSRYRPARHVRRVMGPGRIRLVNQVRIGNLVDRVHIARTNVLGRVARPAEQVDRRSTARSISHSRTAAAFCESGSRVSGSSGKKRGAAAEAGSSAPASSSATATTDDWRVEKGLIAIRKPRWRRTPTAPLRCLWRVRFAEASAPVRESARRCRSC